MRLDYDFHGGGGYAIARRAVDLALPENYQFSFWIRGESPVNTLEFKLIDTTGENVWWRNQRDFEFPREWSRVAIRKRHIEFAWGPIGGGEIRRVAALEIVITASSGGKGTVWIDDLALTPLEPVTAYDLTPRLTASSAVARAPASLGMDGDTATAWRSAAGGAQTLTVDFLKAREYGGLTLDWSAGRHASDYVVETSRDGSTWDVAYTVRGGNGGRDYIYMPDAESRLVRLRMLRGPGRSYALRELTVQPLSWSASRNALLMAVARDAPHGSYPKYMDSVQSYWTIIGTNGGRREALMNEEGMVELEKGAFSVEPFIYLDGKLLTWADGKHTPSLERDVLPIPSVTRLHERLALTVTAFASDVGDSTVFVLRYRIQNRSARPVRPTLYLAVRPLQVNPPWQFLNTTGGVGRLRSLSLSPLPPFMVGGQVMLASPEASAWGQASFDQGDVTEYLRRGSLPPAADVDDSLRLASGALAFPLRIGRGSSRDVWLQTVVLRGDVGSRVDPDASLLQARRAWAANLDSSVAIELPSSAQPIVNTLKTTLAYILINRDGAAIQPGSRSYERSWIRDGSLTSAALLRLGHSQEVREFIEWYAPFQYPNGKVPCCVDHRGADPVPEHDSHGELIYLIAEYYRYTHDRALLERMWPHVEKAVAYIDSLRQSRMTDEYRSGDKRAFYGLVPESISHEGYSAKPMHSFWDDFFVLRGLEDATYIAGVLGRSDEARRFAAMRDDMRRSIQQSLRLTMQQHQIDYIPGSVELGDFDATSTTIAIAPGGELSHLPQDAVRRTFEKYWEHARGRMNGTIEWDAYTPYELRTVGTFVRLGWKDRAHELLDFFMRDRRPAAWNQWAEVVWHDPKTPKFIGDMPHTWVGSDFIRSVLDMFAYEREADDALVVGAGVPESWVTADSGVRVARLFTAHGPLAFTMRGTPDEARVSIAAGLTIPPGGIVLRSPFARPIRSATVNGRSITPASPDEIVLRELPAEVTLRYR